MESQSGLQSKKSTLNDLLKILLIYFFLPFYTADAIAMPVGPSPLTTLKPDIIGGHPADESNNLWQAALVYSSLPRVDGLFCGATFIDAKWLLTAAHCFYNPNTCERALQLKDFYVAHGSVILNKSIELETAVDIFFAPGWDCKTRRDDVALIKLREPIGTQIVRLADESLPPSYLKKGASAWVVGWGITEKGARSAELMESKIKIADLSSCKSAYKEELPEKTFCAGDTIHDTCTGDSGGPLFARTETNQAIQMGIVSFGRGCAKEGFPGVYSRVTDHLPWIRKTSTSSPAAICSPGDVHAERC
ncbi:serine protease [Pseudomonas marginalis]|jgi:secreted trypsin-like serine protease|uniref:serine protease n=1 Tax=Pseudomonas marginalis TaxID=298 RepID=UPI0038B6922F